MHLRCSLCPLLFTCVQGESCCCVPCLLSAFHFLGLLILHRRSFPRPVSDYSSWPTRLTRLQRSRPKFRLWDFVPETNIGPVLSFNNTIIACFKIRWEAISTLAACQLERDTEWRGITGFYQQEWDRNRQTAVFHSISGPICWKQS